MQSQNKMPTQPLDHLARLYIECGIDIFFRLVPVGPNEDEKFSVVMIGSPSAKMFGNL